MSQSSDAARAALLSLVEDHLTKLIREADNVKRHCKRGRLVVQPGGTGGGPADGGAGVGSNNNYIPPTVRSRLHAADINMALRLLGSEKLYSQSTPFHETTDGATASSSTTSSSRKRQKVSLADFLRQDELPLPPSQIGLRMHWLAVDGTQPQIPQNPPSTTLLGGTTTSGGGGSEDATDAAANQSSSSSSLFQVHQLQSSLLSEELQLYFKRVTSVLNSSGKRQQQDAVLLSLSQDAGLQELVPFLVRYCQQELYQYATSTSTTTTQQQQQGSSSSSNNTEHCRVLIRMAYGLLINKHLHLELHLHEWLPALMTCVVAKRLGGPGQNHYTLRREAAAVLVKACDLYGNDYTTLKARVLRTLFQAVHSTDNVNLKDTNTINSEPSSLASRYGGTVALALFGPKAVDSFLLPNLMETWRGWDDALYSRDSKLSDNTRMEIQMCQQATLNALNVYFRGTPDDEKAQRIDWDDFVDTLCDKWVVFPPSQDESITTTAVSEYATCIV